MERALAIPKSTDYFSTLTSQRLLLNAYFSTLTSQRLLLTAYYFVPIAYYPPLSSLLSLLITHNVM
jgi:hypothetical protein